MCDVDGGVANSVRRYDCFSGFVGMLYVSLQGMRVRFFQVDKCVVFWLKNN